MNTRLLNILTALCVTLVVSGVCVLVGVWAMPQWDAYQAEMKVSSMQATASSGSSSAEGAAQLEEAQSYNSALIGESSGSTTPYDRQLASPGSLTLGWLEIPGIDVRRPVFHYDTEDVLMMGLGHVEGTSLPVGGTSTHCCVTGHSGMTGSRMFDDLDKMEIGDVFVFWTLGDPYAYRVYDIEVVEPDDTSSLYIQRGRDLATLITCTPYGINSHRLLVHGERTDYVPEEVASAERHPTSNRLWVLGAGAFAAAAGLGVLLWSVLGHRVLQLTMAVGLNGSALYSCYDDGAFDVRLQLNSFGRAKLHMGADSQAGRWHRDASDIVVDFADAVECNLPADEGETVALRFIGRLRISPGDDGSYAGHVMVNGERGSVMFKKPHA